MNNTTTIRLMAPLAVGAALVWFLGYPGAEGRWLSIALLLALCFISALRFGHSLKIQRQQPTPIASPLLSGLFTGVVDWLLSLLFATRFLTASKDTLDGVVMGLMFYPPVWLIFMFRALRHLRRAS